MSETYKFDSTSRTPDGGVSPFTPAFAPQTGWLVVTLLLVLALLGNVVLDRYRQAQAGAVVKTLNLVQLIESHVASDMARIDGVLHYIAKRLDQPDPQQRLADLQRSFSMIAGLSVFDAQGRLRYSSDAQLKGISIADRPHFQRLRDDATAHVVFSEAQVARTTGHWSITQALALRDADGRFLGTVNAVIALDDIGTLFGTVDVGQTGVILLRNSETFRLMQRTPRNNEKDFNQPLPKDNATRLRIEAGERMGSLRFTASTDGVERLASFKVMDDFPFYVQVALGKSEYLSAWRQEAAIVAGLASVLLAAFVLVMRRLQKSATLTQTVQAELAYRQAMFARLFDQSAYLAGILDQSGRLMEINQAALAVVGLQRKDVVGQLFVDTPWWSRAEDISALQVALKAAAAGTPGSFEAMHAGSNAQEMIVLFHAVPVLAGDVRYIAVTGIDITQRKLAEAGVRDLLQRLQMLAEHLPGFVYQFQLKPDGSSAFPYSSPGIEAVYGLRPEEASQDAGRVFAVLHPDDLARVGASIAHSADTLTVWHDSYRVQHPDGRLLWVEGRSTPTRQPDGSTLWHGYIQDITERKQSEQLLVQQKQSLANILWGTGVGTWEWNVQTGETRFNERWAELIGYTLDELAPISIATWMKYAHPDDLAGSGAALEQHFSGVSDFYECESRMQHKDGHWIWVLDRGKLVSRTPDGQPEWMAGTHWDISDRKQSEQVLEQQTQALARSNTELEQFAYVASHDLRQPLRMVNSYVQLLERALADKLDDNTREMMHFASDGAKRMDQMLVSLLQYSRVGRKGEPMQVLASRAALDEALLFLAPAIADAQATVRVSGDWPQLLGSPDEFTRLWQNLVSNAIKYRAPGRAPEIDISVTPEAQGWRFCVADNGIGIDPAQFERLFKVFARLHTREQYEGSGVGLAVARKIVERHGGLIWVESGGAGQGSRFYFLLPAQLPGTGVSP